MLLLCLNFNAAAQCSADFSFTDNCDGLSVKFNNQSTFTGTLTSTSWEFDNSGSSNQTSPQFTFPGTGSYQVKLIITTSGNCTDSVTKTVTIHPAPAPVVGDTIVCLGQSTQFTGNFPTGINYQSFSWHFGNNSTSSQTNPFYNYSQAGTYYPYLRVTHSDGSSCEVFTKRVRVMDLPNADFTTTSADTLCFNDNTICIKDASTPGSTGAPIQKRVFIWGDGSQTTTNDSNACHDYTDDLGGTYNITLEATDTNGCIDRYTRQQSIVIRPQIDVSFTKTATTDCYGAAVVDLVNTSAYNQNQVLRFEWDFGDGTIDSTNYSAVNHVYTGSGTYTIVLTVWDSIGCIGTDTLEHQVNVSNILLDAGVDTTQVCNGNSFNFTQSTIQDAKITWFFGNGVQNNNWARTYTYPKPGEYVVRVNIKKGNCDTTFIVDTVTVFGPVAKVGDITNQFQCEIHDTVTLVDNSDYSYSYGVTRIWDFDDHTAANCTTDTKSGIHINSNCNFSRDSIARHMYKPGEERCYFPTLTLIDTVTGCIDSVTTPLPLMPPDATGAKFIGDQCLGPEASKAIRLDFADTEPKCLRETHWVIWDSLCAAQSGMPFDSAWEEGSMSHNYTYENPPCDPDGNVTIGLVISNGLDANGNPCYDTAWYHNVLKFNDLDPRFTSDYVEGQHYCPPTSFNFSPLNTNQKDIVSYEWSFGDGTKLTKTTSDSVTHTYSKSGAYTVILKVTNSDGCVGADTMLVKVAFLANIGVNKDKVCLGTPVNFSAKVKYLINPGGPLDSTQFWQNPGRIAAGKETLMWDLGDGQGFVSTSPTTTHTYNETGIYTVRLALKDSTGCRDTLTIPDFIKVYDVEADFQTAGNKLFCFQLVEFLDSSRVNSIPALGLTQPVDSVVKWNWRFGDGRRPSILKNPVHDYTSNGDFDVTLAVENTIGCKDTLIKTITIEGPAPRFNITSDSIGCAPLTVHFENTSAGTQNFIWRFGDENNTTLSTTEDSSVSFTYTKPGTYFIYLFGDDTLTDPVTGNRKYCSAIFPDTLRGAKIKVVVRATPSADFEANVTCAYNPVQFTNTSGAGGGSFNSFLYDFGDGSTAAGPDTVHLYQQPGDYNVTFTVENVNGCTDTVTKTISIPALRAAFYTDSTTLCPNQFVNFFDTSAHDVPIKSWQWTFGNGDSSNLQNPQAIYTTDGLYDVTLIITDTLNCTDTLVKPEYIQIISMPLATEIYRATVESNTSVNVNWKEFQQPGFAYYHLYRETVKGSGNFVKIHTTDVQQDTSFTETGLNTLTTSYCYKLQVEDICGNISNLDSFPAHCTVELTATPGINRVLLEWNQYTGWQNGVEHYEVLREIPQQPGQFTHIGTVPGGDTTFIDSAIICYQTHYYQIRAVELNGNLTTSLSDTSGATPEYISTLPNPDLVTATVVDDDYVRIDLDLDYTRYPYEWHLEKSTDGNTYNFMDNLPGTSTSYNDLNVNVDARSYFYRVQVQDSCGDWSNFSNYGKTILLKTEMPEDQPLINWSRYEEWPEGVQDYAVQLYDVQQQQWVTKGIVDSATFNFTDNPPALRQNEYCYRVQAQRNGRPNVTSTSNEDCVPVELTLFAPNAFTPGGSDTINSGFRLKGTFVFEYKLQIYTRWGELIFETNDLYEEWDGTYKGYPSPEGVYIFLAIASGPAGQVKSIDGTLTLLR